MVPVVRVVGRSDAGKTSVIEGLTAELKGRGYRVATIKHTLHNFEMDQPGKDSWRLFQAGSDAVVLSAPHKLAAITRANHDASLIELRKRIGLDADIVLAEGFKSDRAPTIEVIAKGSGDALLSEPEGLMAIVTDDALDSKVPQYSHDDRGGLADLIERTLMSNGEEDAVDLYVNGQAVPMNIFVRTIFSRVLLGMVSSLKRLPEADTIEIVLKRNRQS